MTNPTKSEFVYVTYIKTTPQRLGIRWRNVVARNAR